MDLFDALSPKPGTVCPCCRLAVPPLPKLRVSRKHPETSKMALADASKSQNRRTEEALSILRDAGMEGRSDDEIDAITEWGHQCTTPIMHALRESRRVMWLTNPDGTFVTRKTRKDKKCRVNVLAMLVGLGDGFKGVGL